MKIEMEWHDPKEKAPPFGKVILAAVESSIDHGRGFVRTLTIYTLKVMMRDADADGDEGKSMWRGLKAGTLVWDDAQFMCVEATLDDDLDFYSDSIVWWADMPELPLQKVA